MAVDLVIHPIVGLTAVSLVLAAFTAKVRRRKFFRLHYVLGLSALAAASTAFALGLVTVADAVAAGVEYEETLTFHLMAATILLLVLLVQARWGLRMWRGKPREPILPRHRALGRTLAVLALIVASLGAITFLTIT